MFKEVIANKNYHYFGNIIKDIDYNLYDHIQIIKNHLKKEEILSTREKQSIELRGLESRGSIPEFAKNIIKELRKAYNSNITLIAFSGYGAKSKSFKIHKDTMDVFYLQVYGKIIWAVWESESKDLEIYENESVCLFKQTFMPGDMIYIPAGTYHYVEHHDEPRVGFSFGNA